MLQPLIKKELRLAAGPLWLVLICSIILAGLAWESGQGVWNPVITWLGFGGICAYLITSQFGSEISLNCLEWGISQPWSRAQYWKQKSLIAFGIYGVVVLVLMCVTLWLHRGDFTRGSISLEEFGFVLGVMSWACLGPGIFLVLKYRNMVASMWLACLLPIGLALLIAYPFKINGVADSITATVVGIAECLYGALGLWLAWRTFLKWEASGCGSMELTFPKRRTKEQQNRNATYYYSPIKASILREFRLQKTNMMLALACVLCGVTLLVVQKVFPLGDWFGKELDAALSMLPQFFQWIICLIPCTMACVTIAESRRMDVHVCELVSTSSRRMQVFIKVIMALVLGWLCAVVLPLPIPWLLKENPGGLAQFIIFSSMITVVFSAVGFYASSMVSGFLKAFSASLIIVSILSGMWFSGLRMGMMFKGWLSFWLPFLIMMVFLIRKTYVNFCMPTPRGNTVRWNLLQSLCMIGFVLSIGWLIEDRFWERWTLAEPKKEDSILKPGVQPSLHLYHSRYDIALSPDGTLWRLGDNTDRTIRRRSRPFLQNKRIPVTPPEGYWISLVTSGGHRFVLDSEHRLWYWAIDDEYHWVRSQAPFPALVELGAGREWVQIAGSIRGYSRVVAVAADGTLWSGGESTRKETALAELPEMVQVDAVLPRMRRFESGYRWAETPIDPSSDWVDCLVHGLTNFALNSKGELYAWGRYDGISALGGLPMVSGESITQIFPGEWKFTDIDGSEDSSLLLTAEDGDQWISANSVSAPNIHWTGPPSHVVPTLYRIDQVRSIRQVTETFYRAPGRRTFIKEDGTLWEGGPLSSTAKPNPSVTNTFKGGTISLGGSPIGQRDDWVAKTQCMGMTADGKIWNWDNYVRTRNRSLFDTMLPPRFRHKVVADLNL